MVHVWAASTGSAATALARLEPLLDASEHERAARLRNPQRRQEFTLAHGLLRRELGRALDQDPRTLDFVIGEHGKPYAGPHWSDVTFNLSHSGGQILIAATRGRAVGIDVEQTEREVEWRRLAQRYFSERECRELEDLPEERRRAGFFSGWARKEAVVKAHGAGISLELASFDVRLDPDRDPELLSVRGPQWSQSHWSLTQLSVPDGYVGCLAVEGEPVKVHCWRAGFPG